jgi:hypothetical protein
LARDDFPQPIRDATARRASYVCSNPECRALTIAPADADASKVLYIGKVAHISAAASGGPRYDASITPEARMHISNAIFLCSSCADMIDKNAGTDFSVARLKQWKSQHEEWVRSNLNRRVDSPLSVVAGMHEATGVGNITALDIQGSAIIRPGTISKATGQGNVTATRIGRRSKE